MDLTLTPLTITMVAPLDQDYVLKRNAVSRDVKTSNSFLEMQSTTPQISATETLVTSILSMEIV